MKCATKHLLHCTALYAWIGLAIYLFAFLDVFRPIQTDPPDEYGIFVTVLIYLWKCLPLLIIPQCMFQLIGLTCFNSFQEKVTLKGSPLLAPFVCFRVVTRGLYPRLVTDNLIANIDVCNIAGMTNFMFEVVTDNRIGLPTLPYVREVVVPIDYKSGALYKARALQYCIEEDINRLADDAWVVHLDEETLLTDNSICGILNFVEEGKYDFGQGLITYARGEIVNWLTTLSDSYRVADDCGKMRGQLSVLHKPAFGWKGSYVVARNRDERSISWDHGLEGSIAEDAYFGLLAIQAGYSFNFIEGEMLEKSPFTTMDFLQQRKRWLEGLLLTVHSKKIGIVHKLPLVSVVYSWVLSPLVIAQFLVMPFFTMPSNILVDSIIAVITALNIVPKSQLIMG